MPLTSPISPYDPRWPGLFAEEACRLRPVFGSDLAAIHHVGSTAVPGLAAKPEIDILVLLGETARPDDRTDRLTGQLQALGYRRGGDLSPGHHFFKRDAGGVRTHKLHVCRRHHPGAAEMLRFRDRLRDSPTGCARYQELKLALEQANTGGISEYLAGKAPFIRSVLAGFD